MRPSKRGVSGSRTSTIAIRSALRAERGPQPAAGRIHGDVPGRAAGPDAPDDPAAQDVDDDVTRWHRMDKAERS
jgi:hypothetical protein